MLARNRFLTILAMMAAASMTLASCARQISPGVYEGGHVGTVAETYTGTVQSARVVMVQEDELLQQNTIGGGIGGVAGGLAGHAIDDDGWGGVAATAGGALAGALVGAMAQRTLQRQQAMEYIVRMDDGGLITVVQGTQPQIPVGRRVYVQVGTSGQSRVLPAG
ncbi:MAG TPA: glycine zipper 2TM domain-containing protein [Paracoccaceae bacterium]|nr:glycine zipper 2TM domain-containing protein [Paracoccaceae bacterium]